MLQAARRAVPSLLRCSQGAWATAPARQLASAPQRPTEEEDDDIYELLPPGCSLKDPTYGRSFGANRNSLSDPVLIYDQKPVEEYRPLKKQQPMPQAPLSRAAAEAALQDSKDAKKKAKEGAAAAGGGQAPAAAAEEEDVYVYVPPGSSMRDPVSFPNSMSDPLENRRVYYRDPNPTLRHK